MIESIVNLTAGKIGELLVQEAKLLCGVEDQVQSLQDELKMMKAFLMDMDATDNDKEGGDNRSLATIGEIRKIAYDAEDVIESYILEANFQANSSDLFKRYICFFSSIPHTHQVGSKIAAIKSKINEAMERSKKFRLEDAGGTSAARSRGRIQSSYSHSEEDYVVGLEQDINKLVKVLTVDETQIKVLSILGMGGCGKTTLARKLYKHERVKQHFGCTAWVSISKQWVAKHILLDILHKVSEDTVRLDEICTHQVVVEKLHQYLESKKRRYLIVLDDVWTNEALEQILPAFPSTKNGSKIIVTTRIRGVADYPDLKSYIHEPRCLSEQESWELFRNIARDHFVEEFEALGKDMLKKCEGLPLAVVALAGLLAKKETLEEWGKVKEAMSSKIVEDGRGTHVYGGTVKEVLELSYNDLSYELKPCFLYMALFPEDSDISTGMLTRMWIAEGFITNDQLYEGERLEDVARQYLSELIHRCVVRIGRRNYDGKVSSVQIHDLMRDLCIKKAKEQDFLQIVSSRSQNLDAKATQSRRTILYYYGRMNVPYPTNNSQLRSLMLLGLDVVGIHENITYENVQTLNVQPITKNFKLLRVLRIEGVGTSDGTLPTEIGNLVHLRYLGLRFTNIFELPSSIGNLHNLLTLDYRYFGVKVCKDLTIPDSLWTIKGLRHLYLPYFRTPIERLKFHSLEHLQTLWGLRGGSWMSEELPHLSKSVQKLRISGIQSHEQLQAAFQCPSIIMDSLHTLHLDWEYVVPIGVEVVLKNLEPIIHCQHLRKLKLWGRIEDELACIHFPASIKKLELQFTRLEAEATLGVLGKLPNLKFLNLLCVSFMGNKWTCSGGEFSQLKELKLCSLPYLKEWIIESGALSQLRKVRIWHCERLNRLPEGVKFITTLQELDLFKMTDQFYSRIKRDADGGGEDAHIIQHIPVVRYLD